MCGFFFPLKIWWMGPDVTSRGDVPGGCSRVLWLLFVSDTQASTKHIASAVDDLNLNKKAIKAFLKARFPLTGRRKQAQGFFCILQPDVQIRCKHNIQWLWSTGNKPIPKNKHNCLMYFHLGTSFWIAWPSVTPWSIFYVQTELKQSYL